ncbi:hypothetical protein A3J32_03025 [Candidatus Saccharibacteria bacterium RIFCSPLOWO2_02_FULL_46_7]|nr:MAG: hypothetical protein A3J32_03025 [Candidatus Saccharibacteria bacterium RIFCSPLOWO2_02_FULL_46_7]
MTAGNILSWTIPLIGLLFFSLFYFFDSRNDRKRSKIFLRLTVLSGVALVASIAIWFFVHDFSGGI